MKYDCIKNIFIFFSTKTKFRLTEKKIEFYYFFQNRRKNLKAINIVQPSKKQKCISIPYTGGIFLRRKLSKVLSRAKNLPMIKSRNERCFNLSGDFFLSGRSKYFKIIFMHAYRNNLIFTLVHILIII